MNEKFNWKRSLVSIIIILITAGVVGGTVWYFMNETNQTQKDQIDSLQEQINELSEDSKDAITENEGFDLENAKNVEYSEEELRLVSNWETYNSESHGVTFKYPSGLEVTEGKDYSGTISAISVCDKKLFGMYGGDCVVFAVSIHNESKESVISGFGSQFDDRKETRENIILNGVNATKVTTSSEEYDVSDVNIILYKNDLVYSLHDNGSGNLDLYYKSFKFIN